MNIQYRAPNKRRFLANTESFTVHSRRRHGAPAGNLIRSPRARYADKMPTRASQAGPVCSKYQEVDSNQVIVILFTPEPCIQSDTSVPHHNPTSSMNVEIQWRYTQAQLPRARLARPEEPTCNRAPESPPTRNPCHKRRHTRHARAEGTVN